MGGFFVQNNVTAPLYSLSQWKMGFIISTGHSGCIFKVISWMSHWLKRNKHRFFFWKMKSRSIHFDINVYGRLPRNFFIFVLFIVHEVEGSTILAGNFAEAGPDNDMISKYSRWLPCTFSYSVWREGMLGGISRGIRSVGSSELSSHACTHASATWTLASPSRGHWHSNRTQQVPFSRLGVGRRAQLCITEGEDLLALLFFSPPTDPPLSPQLMEEECVQKGGDKFSICAVK
jgi:hypothetical protein